MNNRIDAKAGAVFNTGSWTSRFHNSSVDFLESSNLQTFRGVNHRSCAFTQEFDENWKFVTDNNTSAGPVPRKPGRTLRRTLFQVGLKSRGQVNRIE
jgi:hypothetical protein